MISLDWHNETGESPPSMLLIRLLIALAGSEYTFAFVGSGGISASPTAALLDTCHRRRPRTCPSPRLVSLDISPSNINSTQVIEYQCRAAS